MTSSLTVSEIGQLYQLLNSNSWNEIGQIVKESRWRSWACALWDLKTPRLLAVHKLFMASLAYLEEEGVEVLNDQAHLTKNFNPYFDLGAILKKRIHEQKDSYLNTALHRLEVELIALRYRIGQSNKLPQVDKATYAHLKEKALEWKAKQPLAAQRTGLNKLELEQVQEAAKYKEWASLIGIQSDYDDEFFNWSLRDYNRVDVFIEWRQTQLRIKGAYLSGLIGRLRRHVEILDLQVIKIQGIKKRVLTLPIYDGKFDRFEAAKQKRINILKLKDKVSFETSTWTVEEIWKECGAKNWRESRINLCAWGLINLHPVKGVWNDKIQDFEKPKLSKENWKDHVPPIEVLTHQEMNTRFGYRVNSHNFFVKITATRSHPGLHGLDCHSSLELYERKENDCWKVMNVGAYAERFAQNLLDKFWLFGATLNLVWSLVDQSAGLSHRQEAGFVVFSSHKNLSDLVYDLMHTPGVFQFSAFNCSHPLQEEIKKVTSIPNLFCMPITQTKSGVAAFDRLLDLIDQLPDSLRQWAVWGLGTMLLAHRGLSVKDKEGKVQHYSVMNHFSKSIKAWNPAFLAHQIEQAKTSKKGEFINGELFWGNTERNLLYRDKKD